MRELPRLRIGKEVRNRLHVGGDLSFRLSPGVVLRVGVEGRVEVVRPSDAVFVELLEYRALGERKGLETVVVLSVSVGCTGCQVRPRKNASISQRKYTTQDSPVGVGGSRNVGEPTVKQHEVLRHCSVHRNLILRYEVDRFSSNREIAALQNIFFFLKETTHGLGFQKFLGGHSLVGVESSEYLEGHPGN